MMDMVKVKTLVEHRNELGETLVKEAGQEYDAPEEYAEMLIGEKLVEKVAEKAKGKAEGSV